jgi:DNA-nicking Smr family endonuclease
VKSFAELDALQKALAERKLAEEQAKLEAQRAAARANQDAHTFRQAIAGTEPMKSTSRVHVRARGAAPVPRQKQLDEAAALAESLSDEIDIERLLDTDEALSYRRNGIGADIVRRLRRGDWVVKQQIDLHGMRVDEAREALTLFLAQSVKREHRCVRVIHGKGLGSVNREPVLKGKVLKWLVQREVVLAFCQARPDDGGSGALIVLLRAAGSVAIT